MNINYDNFQISKDCKSCTVQKHIDVDGEVHLKKVLENTYLITATDTNAKHTLVIGEYSNRQDRDDVFELIVLQGVQDVKLFRLPRDEG